QQPSQTLSQHSSPLEILESHLQGEFPQSPKSKPIVDDLSIPTDKVYDNIFSSFERLTQPITDYVIRSPEPETANTEPVNPEVESSPESIEIPSEKPTSEKLPSEQPTSEQPIPHHVPEPIP
ncbi:hypothetical protein A2U01_0060883, partial [Trifolium medium]|nr:hypothetical protein [Trifolium medium]